MAESYISVYNAFETDFSHNGLRVLCPLTCSITEVLNGDYSLAMTHPVDKYGHWEHIKENNILKVQGQLFRIYKKTVTMTSDGSLSVSVSAMHIFYDLNAFYISHFYGLMVASTALLRLSGGDSHNNPIENQDGLPTDRFRFSTDIYSDVSVSANYHSLEYDKVSLTAALIGEENSFVNVYGGEIERDNFNVRINRKVGEDNVFSVRYGVDMTEIQTDVDFSDYSSSVYYYATVYNEWVVEGSKERNETVFTGAVNDPYERTYLPIKPMRPYEFEIDYREITKEDGERYPTISEIKAECDKKALEYLLTECQPKITYTVKFANLYGQEKYKDFIGLRECRLGATVTVYNEPLGIETTQRVVRRTVDGITGEVISIELGIVKKTLTSELARKR